MVDIKITNSTFKATENKAKLDSFINELKGLQAGNGKIRNDDIRFLDLDGNLNVEKKELEQLITTLENVKNTGNVNELGLGRDFNKLSTKELELLKHVLTKGENTSKQLAISKEGNYNVFTTSGGYTIKHSGSTINIYRPDGEMMTRVWGDPHVNENLSEQSGWANWHFGDDSTFILPDGSKLLIDTYRSHDLALKERYKGYNNIMVAGGVYVVDGDKVGHSGMKVDEGSSSTSSSTRHAATFLDTTAAEFDAEYQDFSTSRNIMDKFSEGHQRRSDKGNSTQDEHMRSGVFAYNENTEQWAMKGPDGKFYDVDNEAWGQYVKDDAQRQALQEKTGRGLDRINGLFVGNEVAINRDQAKAALDGQDILAFAKLEELHASVELENLFLEGGFKSEYKDKLLNNPEFLEILDFKSEISAEDFEILAYKSSSEIRKINKDLALLEETLNIDIDDELFNSVVNGGIKSTQIANAEKLIKLNLKDEDGSSLTTIELLKLSIEHEINYKSLKLIEALIESEINTDSDLDNLNKVLAINPEIIDSNHNPLVDTIELLGHIPDELLDRLENGGELNPKAANIIELTNKITTTTQANIEKLETKIASGDNSFNTRKMLSSLKRASRTLEKFNQDVNDPFSFFVNNEEFEQIATHYLSALSDVTENGTNAIIVGASVRQLGRGLRSYSSKNKIELFDPRRYRSSASALSNGIRRIVGDENQYYTNVVKSLEELEAARIEQNFELVTQKIEQLQAQINALSAALESGDVKVQERAQEKLGSYMDRIAQYTQLLSI